MNATEARVLSNLNVPKLVESQIVMAKTVINSSIRVAAKNGEYSTSVLITLDSHIQNEVVNHVETYYRKEGYKIEKRDYFFSKKFQISWSEEKDGE
jgi:hypothetical protein